jgi:hypothetical protein
MAAPIDPPPGFEDLPIEETLASVQAPWDPIAQDPGALQVPAWHAAVIAQRFAEARSSTAAVRSWVDVRAELRARLQAVRQ